MRLSPVFFPCVALACIASFASPKAANADLNDPQVSRLLMAKKTLEWNQVINGARYGHAETLVNASADDLAKTALEFGKYKDLHHKFASTRILSKEGDKTDVYMQYPVVIGPIKIKMYEVMRFNADHEDPNGTHFIEAYGIKGDMKRGHTMIRVKPVDATHSIVEVDILLVPTLPAPQSYVDEELRDGAYDFVNGLRDHTQATVGPVTSL